MSKQLVENSTTHKSLKLRIYPSEYLFKLNLNAEFKREKDLINEFKNYFGEDAIIAVEYVNEIPLLNSGKRKKVMNLML